MPDSFKRGDIVRADGGLLGVVLVVVDASEEQDGSAVELLVDSARDGVPDGVSVWAPAATALETDREARELVRHLGLGQ